MRRRMRKMRILNVRRYAARLIDLNKYLDSFPGGKLSGKLGVTELNELFLNSMPNTWIMQAYVQGFYCESVTFKKAVNMFKCVDIAESIYKGLV